MTVFQLKPWPLYDVLTEKYEWEPSIARGESRDDDTDDDVDNDDNDDNDDDDDEDYDVDDGGYGDDDDKDDDDENEDVGDDGDGDVDDDDDYNDNEDDDGDDNDNYDDNDEEDADAVTNSESRVGPANSHLHIFQSSPTGSCRCCPTTRPREPLPWSASNIPSLLSWSDPRSRVFYNVTSAYRNLLLFPPNRIFSILKCNYNKLIKLNH